jgi:3'-phosphoadenosine 5'-phosphosulfate (PAPS) 3'-phosphatase
VAAGSILIEEAGGKMTDLKDERWNLRTRKICGSNGGKVHEKMLKALGEANVVLLNTLNILDTLYNLCLSEEATL